MIAKFLSAAERFAAQEGEPTGSLLRDLCHDLSAILDKAAAADLPEEEKLKALSRCQTYLMFGATQRFNTSDTAEFPPLGMEEIFALFGRGGRI